MRTLASRRIVITSLLAGLLLLLPRPTLAQAPTVPLAIADHQGGAPEALLDTMGKYIEGAVLPEGEIDPPTGHLAAKLISQLYTDWANPVVNFEYQSQLIDWALDLRVMTDPQHVAEVSTTLGDGLIQFYGNSNVGAVGAEGVTLRSVLFVELAAAIVASPGSEAALANAVVQQIVALHGPSHPMAADPLFWNYLANPLDGAVREQWQRGLNVALGGDPDIETLAAGPIGRSAYRKCVQGCQKRCNSFANPRSRVACRIACRAGCAPLLRIPI